MKEALLEGMVNVASTLCKRRKEDEEEVRAESEKKKCREMECAARGRRAKDGSDG